LMLVLAVVSCDEVTDGASSTVASTVAAESLTERAPDAETTTVTESTTASDTTTASETTTALDTTSAAETTTAKGSVELPKVEF